LSWKKGSKMSSGPVDLDIIEELRLRRWARENYATEGQRQAAWHPIVHEEMSKKDLESGRTETAPEFAFSKC
jgi:hypothetical protein